MGPRALLAVLGGLVVVGVAWSLLTNGSARVLLGSPTTTPTPTLAPIPIVYYQPPACVQPDGTNADCTLAQVDADFEHHYPGCTRSPNVGGVGWLVHCPHPTYNP